MAAPVSPPTRKESSSSSSMALKLGDPVHVTSHDGSTLDGVVAFLGETEFQDGHWVGVMLTGPSVGLGKNDGSVKGIRYFECGTNCGLFVRRSHAIKRKLSRLEELRLKRELAKSSSKQFPKKRTPRASFGNYVASNGTASSKSRRNDDEDSEDDMLDDLLGEDFDPEKTPKTANKARLDGSTGENLVETTSIPIETEPITENGHTNKDEIVQEVDTTTTEEKIPWTCPQLADADTEQTLSKNVEVTQRSLHDEDSDDDDDFLFGNHEQPTTTLNGEENALTIPLLSPPPVLAPPPTLRRRPLRLPTDNEPPLQRILDRDGAFFQSRGRWGVQRMSQRRALRHTATFQQRCRIWWDNWFHSLAHKPTLLLMAILFFLYAAAVFFFAGVYWFVSWMGEKYTTNDDGSTKLNSFCGMDITNHMEALYFSLSTMTTIGYGVSDYYFGDCWTPLLLVLWQVCTALTFDAVAIGLIFQRISRGQKRGKTIVFSDKAVIQQVRGELYLMFRVGELRRHSIIEATIRAYCLRHERYPLQNGNGEEGGGAHEIETTHFVTRHVNLYHPEESTQSHILMSVPQVIVHKLDIRSPLNPPPTWYDAMGEPHRLKSNESMDENGKSSATWSHEEIQSYMRDRELEFVVLVEGIDEITGSALQARHSYCWKDIAWNHTLVSCICPSEPEHVPDYAFGRSRITPRLAIHFDKFHEIKPAPLDSDACPYIPLRP